METRITRLEAIIPTLATREDLACLEGRMNVSIQRLETILHQEISKQTQEISRQTWRLFALLAGLVPALFAAAIYVLQNTK